MEAARVGTSGWIYKSWAQTFYPPDVGKTGHLEHYARRFDTVEINASFYRLPPAETARAWSKKVPRDFVFALKGSRFITHMKKLAVDGRSIEIFFERARMLGRKLGPILWQLPPQLGYDPERLERFLKTVPRRHSHAVEFRHPSWYDHETTFDILRERRAAHVCVSSLGMARNLAVTADFTYVRFHGLDGGAAHDYTRRELRPWADHCRRCLETGVAVYAYFNNDANTRAPKNADTFREMIGVVTPAARAASR
ncbi:MAG TPA: DUF72 domain-containing protein [Candidatus Limnocylindrales bacterium]|nr:DUF72 domain-containing protein [Candidatus Limnocylindrales bacterium]